MDSTVYISLSHQVALKSEMDVVAHNIANASTTAHKGERMMFSEYLTTDENGQTVSFVEEAGLFRDDTQGELRSTHNPLDLAFEGGGYFVVQTEDGERYTRGGHFQLDAERNMVTMGGFKLLGEDGMEITFAERDVSIQIAKNGTVRSESGEIGKLRVVQFEQPGSLVKARSGLYSSTEIPVDAVDVHIEQGMLEASNVQPIVQVTRMIDILRAYQSAQKLSNTDHDLMRKTINEILKVST